MKKGYFVLLLLFCISRMYSQTTNNWVGGVSTDYFNVNNWNPSNLAFNSLNGNQLVIGAGSPNNCIHTGGSNSTSYISAKLNTTRDANFTVNGKLYTYGTDSLNGVITVNAPADFNIRSGTGTVAYIGNMANAIININGGALSTRNGLIMGNGTGGSATVTVTGGSLNVGGNGANMDLTLATGAGTTANLNITGGTVKIVRNLNIGAGGNILISSIGILQITGDKRTQLNGLITSGQLTCTPGLSLAVTYDGTNTYAKIPQNPNSMITEYPDSVVLKTGDIVCNIEKNTGNVLSYRFKGVETVANKSTDAKKYIYHDFTTSYGFETLFGCTYGVVQDSADFAHIVFKRPYTPSKGHVTPCDAEIHYALKKNDKGVYVYSKLEHKPSYKAFDIGSWRQVWWIAANNGTNLCERIYTDSLRSWEMPAPSDTYTASAVAEIVKMTSGVRSGKYDGKYEYSMKFWDNPLWGHASNINNIGCWVVNTSCEYYNEGPMYHDLNAAAGIIHQCMNGVHYGAGGIFADTLTTWTKVYGPYLMLLTDKSTGDDNWAAAKQRLAQEKMQWPYSWVKDTIAYPLTAQRGAITGKLVITDALKPAVNGGNAWIGVTNLADGATNFQFECKDYQYWIRTAADGSFTIPNVRPGTYSLFAFKDSSIGEYRQDNVTVAAGGTNNLGTLTRTIDRSIGSLAWEIGTPNRMADEFKLGNFEYAEGFIQNKFRDTFPNPVEYNVVDNDWATKLCFAHTKYPNESLAPGDAWKWRLNFTLPANTPTTGNARLTIAYASADHAQQWIYVNNESSTFNTFYPDYGDGNAFIRQSNYAKYSYKQILIPMNRLVSGNNTITLVMPSNSGWVSHLMYDYLSLEVPDAIILPINLLSFEAKAVAGKKGQLSWKTTAEKNASHFEVERSADGLKFNNIGSVKATAINGGGSYQFTDAAPLDGANYYRLKLVDNDGKFTYSAIRQINFTAADFITAYPNPATSFVLINTNAGKAIKTIAVTDAAGKIVAKKINVNAPTYRLDISAFAKGLYFLQITDGETTVVKSVTKN